MAIKVVFFCKGFTRNAGEELSGDHRRVNSVL